MIRFAVLLPAMLMIGCTEGERPATAPAPGVECDAGRVGSLIGEQRSEKVGKRARKLSGARTLRWLAPGSMMTMDFRTDRLNLHVDAAGKIVSARCG